MIPSQGESDATDLLMDKLEYAELMRSPLSSSFFSAGSLRLHVLVCHDTLLNTKEVYEKEQEQVHFYKANEQGSLSLPLERTSGLLF
jgi:hypothetical protein